VIRIRFVCFDSIARFIDQFPFGPSPWFSSFELLSENNRYVGGSCFSSMMWWRLSFFEKKFALKSGSDRSRGQSVVTEICVWLIHLQCCTCNHAFIDCERCSGAYPCRKPTEVLYVSHKVCRGVGNVQEGWSQFLDRCDLFLFCLISIWLLPSLSSHRFLYWLCVSLSACFRTMKFHNEHNLEDDWMSNLGQSCLLVCVICLHCSWRGRSVSRSETLGCLEIWWKAFHQPCVGLLCCLRWNCAWESGWPIHERDSDSRGMQWVQPFLWIQATCKGGQWCWVEQP